MKSVFVLLLFSSGICFGQQVESEKRVAPVHSYVEPMNSITLEAAFELTKRAAQSASGLGRKISIAILDAAGATLLLTRNKHVGPHNTEAARRKAYTALSTKSSTLLLLRNAASNTDTKNLNTLPELLLLSGGVPIWFEGEIIGSIGVAGGGTPENDDLIAQSVSIPELGITTTNQLNNKK